MHDLNQRFQHSILLSYKIINIENVQKSLGSPLKIRCFFNNSQVTLCSIVFLIASLIRAIPELIVSWYPVGYETITFYAPPMFTFSRLGFIDVFLKFHHVGPLFYELTWILQIYSNAHPFIILKVLGPVLYGGLAVSFFIFLKRGMKVDNKIAFIGTLFLLFQIATLRQSWDRFRTILALMFFFATLTALKSNYKFKGPVVGFLTILTVLSRDYVAVVLFITVLGSRILTRKNLLKPMLTLIPGLILFSLLYLQIFWEGYLSPQNPFIIRDYFWAVQDIISISVIYYSPLLFFAIKGWKNRERLFDPLIIWLIISSISVIFIPGYQRWLNLLIYPVVIYSIKGFEKIGLFKKKNQKKLLGIIFVFAISGLGYSSGLFSYAILPNSWIPNNLVQSSISWNQINDVKESLYWLQNNAENNSALLVEERFYGWTSIYFEPNFDVKIFSYFHGFSPETSLKEALHQKFNTIFLISYSDLKMDNFEIVFSQEDISIFKYCIQQK